MRGILYGVQNGRGFLYSYQINSICISLLFIAICTQTRAILTTISIYNTHIHVLIYHASDHSYEYISLFPYALFLEKYVIQFSLCSHEKLYV